MAKILGLDLGTNSIGWAIRDNNIDNKNQILDSGVLVFSQGVGEEKGVEFSLASERTKKELQENYIPEENKGSLIY